MKKFLAVLLIAAAVGFSNWFTATHPSRADNWIDQIIGQSILEIFRLACAGALVSAGALLWPRSQ